MALSLRDAIAQSITFGDARVEIRMSMHDADGPVLLGVAQARFVADLPLRDAPVRVESSTSATTGIGHWFTRQPTPGFSTREAKLGGPDENYYLVVPENQKSLMDFSVRRDPGVPIMQWVRGGPNVQIEIETAANSVTLDADEDGLYLRAVGPSIADRSHRAVYTVTFASLIPIVP